MGHVVQNLEHCPAPKTTPLNKLTFDIDTADPQGLNHSLDHRLHRGVVRRDVGQLPGTRVPVLEEQRQLVHILGLVDGGIRVADGVHTLSEGNEDRSKQQRQADLNDCHQNLTLLQKKAGTMTSSMGKFK